MKPFRRIAALLFLSAYALSSGAGGTWVLCYGVDGHVTVEAGKSACCLGTRAETPPGPLESAMPATWTSVENPPGCGACTDVPIFASSTAHAGPSRSQAREGVAAAFSFPFPADALEAPPPGAELPQWPGVPRSDGTLTRLRTVVLRC
jgi:hypothetical protein